MSQQSSNQTYRPLTPLGYTDMPDQFGPIESPPAPRLQGVLSSPQRRKRVADRGMVDKVHQRAIAVCSSSDQQLNVVINSAERAITRIEDIPGASEEIRREKAKLKLIILLFTELSDLSRSVRDQCERRPVVRQSFGNFKDFAINSATGLKAGMDNVADALREFDPCGSFKPILDKCRCSVSNINYRFWIGIAILTVLYKGSAILAGPLTDLIITLVSSFFGSDAAASVAAPGAEERQADQTKDSFIAKMAAVIFGAIAFHGTDVKVGNFVTYVTSKWNAAKTTANCATLIDIVKQVWAWARTFLLEPMGLVSDSPLSGQLNLVREDFNAVRKQIYTDAGEEWDTISALANVESQLLVCLKHANDAETATIKRMLSSCDKLHQAIGASVSDQSFRTVPLCVVLIGDTGIGKSFTTDHIKSEMLPLFLSKEEKRVLAEDHDEAKYIWTKNKNDKFDSGADARKKIYIGDDIRATKDTVDVDNLLMEMRDILTIVNPAPMLMHMPDVESKGRVPCRANLYLLSTNNTNWMLGDYFSENGNQISRRIHFVVYVRLVEEYATMNNDGKSVVDAKKLADRDALIDRALDRVKKAALAVAKCPVDNTNPDDGKPLSETELIGGIGPVKRKRLIDQYSTQLREHLDRRMDHQTFDIYRTIAQPLGDQEPQERGLSYRQLMTRMKDRMGSLKEDFTQLMAHQRETIQSNMLAEAMSVGNSDEIVQMLSCSCPVCQRHASATGFLSSIESMPEEQDKIKTFSYTPEAAKLAEEFDPDLCLKDQIRGGMHEKGALLFIARRIITERIKDATEAVIPKMWRHCTKALARIEKYKLFLGSTACVGACALLYKFISSGDDDNRSLFDLSMSKLGYMSKQSYPLRSRKPDNTIQVVERQALIDRTSDVNPEASYCISLMAKSLYYMKVSYSYPDRNGVIQEKPFTFQVMQVAPGAILIQRHFLELFNQCLEGNARTAMFTLCRLDVSPEKNKVRYSRDLKSIKVKGKWPIFPVGSSDGCELCLLYLESFNCSNEIKRFPTSVPEAGVGYMCSTIYGEYTALTRLQYRSDIKDRSCDKLIQYDIPTQAGCCGTPIVASVGGAPRIIAFHALGDSHSLAFGIHVTKDQVETAYNRLLGQYNCAVEDPMDSRVLQGVISPTSDFDVETLDDRVVTHQAVRSIPFKGNTKLRRTILTIEGSTIDVLPSAQTYKAMENARDGYGESVVAPNAEFMDLAIQSLISTLAKDCPPPTHTTRSNAPVSVDVAVVGSHDVRPINVATSSGFPAGLYSKEPGKRGFFKPGTHELLDNDAVTSLREDVAHYLEVAKTKVPVTAFADFLKDELLKRFKVENELTRFISGADFSYVVAVRCTFHRFIQYCMESRISNGTALGVVPYTEWGAIAKYHEADDPNREFIAGDYSHYDKDLSPFLVEPLIKAAEWFYGDAGSEEATVRRNLAMAVPFGLHICGNQVYRWCTSNASGNPLTTLINSFANQALIRYSVLRILSEECADGAIDARVVRMAKAFPVKITTYGDDNMMSFNPADLPFELDQSKLSHWLSTVGMVYTNEAKTGLSANRRLSQVSFLKRDFRYADGMWYAPLAIDSILRPFLWTKNTDDATWLSGLEAQYAELAAHGEETYNLWARRIRASFAEHQELMPFVPDYKSALFTYLTSDSYY